MRSRDSSSPQATNFMRSDDSSSPQATNFMRPVGIDHPNVAMNYSDVAMNYSIVRMNYSSPFPACVAHESRSEMVRLNTSFSPVVSASTQK